MFLTVKLLLGRRCSLKVTGQESVATLKKMVSKKLQVPEEQQHLLFHGQPLADDKCLSDYRIGPHASIHVIVRPLEKPSSSQAHQFLWHHLDSIIAHHFAPEDAKTVLQLVRQEYEERLQKISLEDLEQLANYLLTQELSEESAVETESQTISELPDKGRLEKEETVSPDIQSDCISIAIWNGILITPCATCQEGYNMMLLPPSPGMGTTSGNTLHSPDSLWPCAESQQRTSTCYHCGETKAGKTTVTASTAILSNASFLLPEVLPPGINATGDVLNGAEEGASAMMRYALPGSARLGQGPAGAAAMGTPLLSFCLLDGVGHQSFAPEPGSTDAGPRSRVGTAGGSRRTLGPGPTTPQAAFHAGPAPQGDPSTQLAGVPLASPEGAQLRGAQFGEPFPAPAGAPLHHPRLPAGGTTHPSSAGDRSCSPGARGSSPRNSAPWNR
ncbi:ubiquitin-like protein 4B [Suncus etruscus]|uniref:ubiquitin-like protein 4B n=1 Tax=Suncus etruscus TaxID=109475 RepID=UPI00210FD905|nr:ubiquitin-like protein 4B [Suncus etruscus]